MSGPAPDEIWQETLEEGQRRLARAPRALTATGFAGGVDVFFSIVALAVVSGALVQVVPEPTAHALASLVFGIGFVFITLGRAELFTENFLVPVGAVADGRGTVGQLLRMWLITMLANFVGIALFAAIFVAPEVLSKDALEAAGTLADTLGQRSAWPAFLSAVAAGTIMTLFTWVVAATEDRTAAVLASLIIGFVLAIGSLNTPSWASGS